MLAIGVRPVRKTDALGLEQCQSPPPYRGRIFVDLPTKSEQRVAKLEAIAFVVDDDLHETARKLDVQSHRALGWVAERVVHELDDRSLDERQALR